MDVLEQNGRNMPRDIARGNLEWKGVPLDQKIPALD